jgi:hypothetical protein
MNVFVSKGLVISFVEEMKALGSDLLYKLHHSEN